ncbi:MAG: hypothetical protein R2710_03620 [Acidimicrobiales bacterium]
MAGPTKLLDAQQARRLGSQDSVLTIGEEAKSPGAWAGRRLLSVSGAPAFELSYWCGTCPFLFQRLEGSNGTQSIDELQTKLSDGLSGVDDAVIAAFEPLLPIGSYVPLLLEIQPTLTHPVKPGDYFAEEQDATWKSSSGFWGLPENPRTPYYRGDTRQLDEENTLFEFVVPMVPPNWNDRSKVEAHAKRLAISSQLTCVALSVLDVRQRAFADTPEEALIHWGLAHFLLDGHHKIEAAAAAGSRLQILSLLSIEHSLADDAAVERIVDSLAGRRSR